MTSTISSSTSKPLTHPSWNPSGLATPQVIAYPPSTGIMSSNSAGPFTSGNAVNNNVVQFQAPGLGFLPQMNGSSVFSQTLSSMQTTSATSPSSSGPGLQSGQRPKAVFGQTSSLAPGLSSSNFAVSTAYQVLVTRHGPVDYL